MIRTFLFVLLCILQVLQGIEPPQEVPPSLIREFTLNNQIPVSSWYINSSYLPTEPLIYSRAEIDDNLERISRKELNYYGLTDQDLYTVLKKYHSKIKGKRIGIIGSTVPWYESIAIYYGAYPITIEYNAINSMDSRIKTMTVAEYERNPIKFDALISISSIEHDGLGRYGDPIDPYGDIKAMQKMKAMLHEDGLLFFAVPIGKDRLVWNAHRIYGKLRFPMIIDGWEIIDSTRFQPQDFERDNGNDGSYQPLLVLKPK